MTSKSIFLLGKSEDLAVSQASIIIYAGVNGLCSRKARQQWWTVDGGL
jgi:hypothetical protein